MYNPNSLVLQHPFPVVQVYDLGWGLDHLGNVYPIEVVLNGLDGQAAHLNGEYHESCGQGAFRYVFNGVGVSVDTNGKDIFTHGTCSLGCTLGHGVAASKDQIDVWNGLEQVLGYVHGFLPLPVSRLRSYDFDLWELLENFHEAAFALGGVVAGNAFEDGDLTLELTILAVQEFYGLQTALAAAGTLIV